MKKICTEGMKRFYSPRSAGGMAGIPTRHALNRVHEVMVADLATRKDGSGRFRPSMLGDVCTRRQLLSYHGAEQADPELDLTQLFSEGTWKHYQWQVAGLSEGFLTDIETPIHQDDGSKWGQIDGRLRTGGLFELKAVRNNVWQKVVLDQRRPKPNHMLQTVATMLRMQVDHASLVYVDRNTGGWFEFVVTEGDPWYVVTRKELERREEVLYHHVAAETMPSMLPDCSRGTGSVWADCLFRTSCVSWGLHAGPESLRDDS
jgi:hypothetical protein